MKRFALLIFLCLSVGAVLAQSTYYVNVRSANARSCAQKTCSIVVKFAKGAQLSVSQLVTGDSVSGSTNWLEVNYNGQLVYVHSSLATTTAPRTTTTTTTTTIAPAVSTTPIAQNASPVPAGSQCGGASVCTAMSSCEQAYACLNAGNGRLDRDNDGVPCESICPGG